MAVNQPANFATNCLHCCKALTPPSGRGTRVKNYCSKTCQAKARTARSHARGKTPVVCDECGNVRYLIHPGKAGRMCRACAVKIATNAAKDVNTKNVEKRFMAFVQKSSNGCWNWTGNLQKNGYSTFGLNGKTLRGHRWSYEHFVSPIPEGLEIDHLCRNRKCVNPHHLEPVTRRENTRRAMRSHCVNGHEFTPENIYMHDGKRYCRTCRRIRVRDYQRRKNGKNKEVG